MQVNKLKTWKTVALIGLVFMLGELWGHTGHGVERSHILRSLLYDAEVFGFIAYLQWLKEDSFRKGMEAAKEGAK